MAYIDFNNSRDNIRRLQIMLRALSGWTGDRSLDVAVNGRYDERTAQAVSTFQRKNQLAESGKVDYVTWNEIAELFRAYEAVMGEGVAINPFPSTQGYILQRGERSNLVLIIQIMLNELRRSYDSYGHLTQSGRFDIAMENAVREFQSHHALKASGMVDRATWNNLAEEYNALMRYSE